MTFLRYPTRENTLSVASSSKDDATREREQRIFAQIFANHANYAKGKVFYNHMVGDDPEAFDPTTNPPEVQKEIEKRKKIVMEISQNIKKRGRGRKRGRTKKQSSTTSITLTNTSEQVTEPKRARQPEATGATSLQKRNRSKSRRQHGKKRRKSEKSFNTEIRREKRRDSST